jgi:hypothetical protein
MVSAMHQQVTELDAALQTHRDAAVAGLPRAAG